MDAFAQWFGERSNVVGSFQIVLDVLLFITVILVVLSNRRSRQAPPFDELTPPFERIIEETTAIARDFDTNLQERQVLIQQLLAKLDQRVREAQELCHRLEELRREPRQVASTLAPPSPVHSDHQKVLRLAHKGLDAEAIAKRLQKPVGEVELILNLERLSSSR